MMDNISQNYMYDECPKEDYSSVLLCHYLNSSFWEQVKLTL